MGKITAVCISEKKGTVKEDRGQATFIENFGLEGDAHGGNWHRQVSLLSFEEFKEFGEKAKIPMAPGIFGENLLVEGLDFNEMAPGVRLQSGDVVLEITQIGKECHKGCEIRNIVGDCIMPRRGVFAKVISGGEIKRGDSLCFLL